MRAAYYEQLQAVVDDVVALTDLVRRALAAATLALLEGDARIAELVIAGDDAIDDAAHAIEEHAFLLMATQQPVATDLRQLVATLRIVADLERIGDHAVHIAKVARLREPDRAVPDRLQPNVRAMAKVADAMIESVAHVVAYRDDVAATAMEHKDDEMDELHRALFKKLLSDTWPHGVEAAVDLALLSRYYERIGDHAVSMARRMIFQVTGARELV